MKGHEFKGVIEGWPGRRGTDVGSAIIKTLYEYEGDSDEVRLKVFIVPNANEQEEKFDDFVAVDVQWVEDQDAWQILQYH